MSRAIENHDGFENIKPSTGGKMGFSRNMKIDRVLFSKRPKKAKGTQPGGRVPF
jgi:hypothetical protein